MIKKGRFVSWVTYIGYLLVVIACVDFAFFRHYLHNNVPKDFKPSKTKIQGLKSRTGWIQSDKKSSYVNFPEHKRAGIVRVGCFGDSFTHGDEVNERYDYPSLLQELFRKKGYDNVEVINFGSGGYGFFQTYMMWEWANKAYGLDFVLVHVPFLRSYERDGTFRSKFARLKDVYFGHARYILKSDNEVERLDLIGSTQEETVWHYLRFIPHFRYLRFDIHPPFFLTAPLEALFPDKELQINPFYYKKDLKKEMEAIYKILLNKMLEESSQVILGAREEDVLRLWNGVRKANFFMTFLDWGREFPYVAFNGHHSPLGNQFLAQQMFDCLTNKTETISSVLEIRDIDRQSAQSVQVEKVKLSAYKNIALEVGGVPVGRFYDVLIKDKSLYCKASSCDLKVDTFLNTTSLVFLENNKKSALDPLFLPLDFEIKDGLPVVIRVRSGNRDADYSLGSVRLLNQGLNIGKVNGLYCDSKRVWIKKEKGMFVNLALHRGDAVTILIGGVPVLFGRIKGSKDSYIFLEPVGKRLFVIRGDGRQIVDTEALPKEGIVHLLLERDGQAPVRIPFARWQKVNKKRSLGSPRSHFIRMVPGTKGQ